MTVAWLAALATIAGAICLYASTPHQALLAGNAAAGPLRWLGIALFGAALILLLTLQGPATAVFTWLTGGMLVWSVVPVTARWLRFRKEQGK